jgi:hypothetical protein
LRMSAAAFARPNQIVDRFMHHVRNPHRRQFAGGNSGARLTASRRLVFTRACDDPWLQRITSLRHSASKTRGAHSVMQGAQ